MESRVTTLERNFTQVRNDLSEIKESLKNLLEISSDIKVIKNELGHKASKADISSSVNKMIMWAFGAVIAAAGIAIKLAF